MRSTARILSLIAFSVLWLWAPSGLGAPAMTGQRLPIEIGEDDPDVSTVTVVKGDHLWSISETHLEALLDRSVESKELVPYWKQVIAANLRHLRSGKPDLIFPGETVLLPEPDQRTATNLATTPS